MPENPKKKRAAEKKSKEIPETGERSSPGKDPPEEKSYYYDDAHGYEIYNPDEDDNDDEA